MIVDINNICIYYSLFILFRTGILLIKVHSVFLLAIKHTIIVDHDFDCCRYTNNDSHFCNTHYNMIVEKQIA